MPRDQTAKPARLPKNLKQDLSTPQQVISALSETFRGAYRAGNFQACVSAVKVVTDVLGIRRMRDDRKGNDGQPALIAATDEMLVKMKTKLKAVQ